jgi:hypothetical protein
MDAGNGHHDLGQPAVHGPSGVEPAADDRDLADPADVSLGHKSVQRWNLPGGWVISRKPAHPALVSEADFISAQDISAARGPAPDKGLAAPRQRRYLLAGLLVCGGCGRRMESAWSTGKPAYRCRHGRTTAARPGQGRAGPGTPTSAKTGSCRICPPCTCSSPSLPEDDADGAPAAVSTSGISPARGCDRVPARPPDHSHLRSGLRHPERTTAEAAQASTLTAS